MGASSDDEPDAYKSSAAAQPQYTVFFFINPDADPTDDSSSVLAAIPRGLNFGLSAAVLQYSRKPALITAFLRRFLWVPVDSYVDDYQVAEPDFSRGPEAPAAGCHLRHPLSGQAMLWAAYALFGMRPLRLDKSTPWSSGPCPFVGVTTDFRQMISHGVILVNIKPSTREKSLILVEQALSSGTLVPQTAATLFGKLRWVFGTSPLGRASLSAVKRRQYSDGQPPWLLDADLLDALSYVRTLLSAPPFPAVVRVSPSSQRPVLVWTDASWDPEVGKAHGRGHVGFVAKFPAADGAYETVFAESPVPSALLVRLHQLRAQETFIHPSELVGIMAPYISPDLQGRFDSRFVLHFGDNQAANQAAVNGASSSPDLNALVHSHHLRLAASDTRLWVEWVPSAANIADGPSRGRTHLLESVHGARRVRLAFPVISGSLGTA